jgi:alpha-methylacyl-CoA racemase
MAAGMTDGAGLLAALFPALAARGLWSERRGANLLDGGAPFYRCFACRDGRFVAVGALEPRFYAALLAELGVDPAEAPQHDPAAWPGLHDRFAAIFATRNRDDWAEHFAGTEACVTPVLTFVEAAAHPHNRARGAHVETGIVQPAPAPRFDGETAPVSADRPAETLDQALARWT